MGEFRADLHCHSTFSDGTYTPKELVELACRIGLQGLSLTDHDTIAGYSELLKAAKAQGLPVVFGLELSTLHQGTSVHVLAYSFSLASPLLSELCQFHQKRRKERIVKILRLLEEQNISLSLADVETPDYLQSIGRPHIAQALLKKGYVSSVAQAFHNYLGEGKCCFVPSDIPSVEATLEVIHQAGGLAVIAHPHLIKNSKTLHDLLAMPFDGIEAYYGTFSPVHHERWLKIGRKKGWLTTGGSDFHGSLKPNLTLGSAFAAQETFDVLYAHQQRNLS